jgi:hypothetical protein
MSNKTLGIDFRIDYILEIHFQVNVNLKWYKNLFNRCLKKKKDHEKDKIFDVGYSSTYIAIRNR